MSLTPDVLWAQREDSVYLTIDVKEVQDMKVQLEPTKLIFSGKVGSSNYALDLEFFAPIKKEESRYKANRLIEFYLKKEEEGSWTHLRKAGKAPFVKIDWAKWKDSDDDEKPDFNVDGMGDMNFGDMMGGGDDFDSDDDEDLPDLEPPSEEIPSGSSAAKAEKGLNDELE
eukprot:TRINITY_DN4127_c0_g1_i2.p2 TRINITY_DN4127_c0_g1~~TRINITY_DN4127_c0_g1_i2.p2  ORF type:complete len:170 (-),score=70.63 TRINITY_DN4127_c0_g1_i2:300-809(-)